MVVIVDKLLKTQIVECSSVATWVFSKEMSPEFTKMYLWEILHLTIKKMNKHAMKLSAELAEAKDKLARDAESSSSEDSDAENPTKKKKENSGEKPTDEVSELMSLVLCAKFKLLIILVDGRKDGREARSSFWRSETHFLDHFPTLHHDIVGTSRQVRHGRKRC